MKTFEFQQISMAYDGWESPSGPCFVWAHGWGQNHLGLAGLAGVFKSQGQHFLVDFPGFGASPPPEAWDTGRYADFMADFIRQHTSGNVIWVGHSFGCRVGLQIAARHPDLIAGLFLIAAAGLPRKRSLIKKLYIKGRIAVYKFLKKLIPFGLPEDWLMKKFASSDYKNAGPMRQILVKVVNEDLSDVARKITCPVTLVYGSQDTETPPEIGMRLKALIKNAEMVHLEGFDHYTILSTGQHQLAVQLKNFIAAIERST
jgi:pimeloyl-ACP methyl ester carboxylesterase